jgi:hypothetical protein
MSAKPTNDDSRLTRILAVLDGHYGRDNAISAPEMEKLTGIPERSIREELSIAYDDGTLEELEMPAVGLPGVGFFLATHIEDFQEAYDQGARVRDAWNRKLEGIRKLAAAFGLHLITPKVEKQ